ncbi:MAG: hypothetical protein JSS30_05315 [Verrucomicrobia bacterium]|nr:hypothetical protein [Verrucomicrobiota bacterium]
MENRFYDVANSHMAQSWEKWELGELGDAWKLSISARLAYLCDTIINLVALPFAIIGVTFGSFHALFTWDWNSTSFQSTKYYITERTNHLVLSLFGSIISPALAHKYRDVNLVPYLIALRITVVVTALVVFYLKKS